MFGKLERIPIEYFDEVIEKAREDWHLNEFYEFEKFENENIFVQLERKRCKNGIPFLIVYDKISISSESLARLFEFVDWLILEKEETNYVSYNSELRLLICKEPEDSMELVIALAFSRSEISRDEFMKLYSEFSELKANAITS